MRRRRIIHFVLLAVLTFLVDMYLFAIKKIKGVTIFPGG